MFAKNITICYYCEEPFKQIGETITLVPITDETVDHIIPRSKGGNSSPLNKVPSCRSCNTLKGNFLPEQFVCFIENVLSGEVKIKNRDKYTQEVLKIVLHNANEITECIEPFRKKLYKHGNIQKDYEKDEITFSELLKQNTEKSKHVTNAEFEVKNTKQKITYEVENWEQEPPVKKVKAKKIIRPVDTKELFQDLKWTNEEFEKFFEGKKHFHTL